MPIKLALKIFATQLVPILLYGVEVWEPYIFTNLQDWGKSETEKVDTQFPKRILGCDIHTSNIMSRTELGRRPLICDIIRKSTLYIKQVKSHLGSLANQALEYESENDDNSNIFQLARRFTPFYQVNQETQNIIEPVNKYEIQKQNFAFMYENRGS